MRAVGPAGRSVGVRHRGDLRPLACLRTKGVAVQHDLVIRAGTVHDGLGSEPRTADVAVDGDRIVEVGRVDGTGRSEIDAGGCVGHAGIRRRAHPLRRPGHLGLLPRPVVVARRHHGRDGQLRRRLRPGPPDRPRPPHLADGGRGGHPRGGAARGPQLGVGDVRRLPRRHRAPGPRHRRGGAGSPRRRPPVRDGRAGLAPRPRHARGHRRHGDDRPGGGGGRWSRLHDVAARSTTAPLRASPRRR